VESFTLDEEPIVDTNASKFLLSAETSDSKLVAGIHLGEPAEMDAQSRANLEALLEADKHLIDADVLRRIASSLAVSDVHCALDEAAQAIAKMRITDSQLTSIAPLSTANVLHKSDQSQELTANMEGSSRLMDDRSERCSVNEVTEEGESFLSFACSSGHYELAKQLLVARANVEDRGLKDTTPLMDASNAGHFNIVELLIKYNAEVNAQTSQGNTPLMFACAGGHEEVVKLLLKSGANVEDHNENGHTPLMEAASAGHVNVATILVEHGASINTHSNEYKESALTLACYKGHLEMVRFLLEAGADQEHKTDEMHTALMEASMDGHVEVARLLLDSGAQVNMPADSFESPLTLAACGGHVELAMLLLERGANIEEVNDEGYTPLMEAAREGHEEMVALLLSQGADINAQTEETQETALTLACCGGFLDVADFLIKAGADIEAGANTPLMEAAQEGHLDLVRHLINCGSNVNATTSSGDTALMYGCENGHTDVAELLLQAGANLEHEAEGGRTSLMKAARAGHLCTVQFLLNRGSNVNKVTTNNDHTPLSLACAGGHLAVVELLLANGSDPTHRLKDSSTMLIEAAKGGHTTVVQLLIDYPTNMMAPSPPLNASADAETTPRIPPHGLQLEDTSSRTHSSISSLQSKLNFQKSISKKNISKDNNAVNMTANKGTDSSDSYVSFSKGRTVNKVLERSLSDSGVSSTTPPNPSVMESTAFSSIDALKEAERLEARINDMIRRTDELDPAKEEQIRQKQQILEELQRVEREYQAHWQQQLLQCYQAGLSCGPSLSQISANIPVDSTGIPSNSQGMPVCLEMASNLQKPIKLETPFQMPSTMSQSTNFQSSSATLAADLSLNLSSVPTQTTFTNTINTSTNTPISLSTPPANRRFRSNSKIKSISSKQHTHQTTLNIPKSLSSSLTSEEVEKNNLKNTINSEHLDPNNSNPSADGQQTQISLLQQQQMILSELAQNFSTRPETLQFLQAAASNMKIDPSIPFLLPRLFNPNVSLSQTSVIQSHQSQPNTQSTPQTTSQSIQTNVSTMTSIHDNIKKTLQITTKVNKLNKSAKVDNTSVSSTTPAPTPAPTQHPTPSTGSLLMNQTTQTQSTSLLQTLSSEQLMLLKTQFAAAASTATQTDPLLCQLSTSSTTAPTLVNQAVYSGSTTSGIYSMGAPAFPVSLTLSPVSVAPSSTTTASSRTSIISTTIPYPTDGVDGNTQTVITNANTTDITSMNTNTSSLDTHIPYALTNTISSLSGNGNSNDLDLKLKSSKPEVLLQNTIQSTTTTTPANIRIPSPPPWFPPVDLDCQTDSNHDTALTLACAGGHEELVSLLLNRGAEMEHRDKKGFTPLMLAATAGHLNVVEIMLNNGADMEAQSERTKDTALSLACSSGRFEVVEILLSRGSNKEHRNVSDYTPLSLAASGGYVNIIKLLLSHGAEINSRTGSKLGISPLMLAAMNGHAATVKLLLDMGSDINAQIETNRNTALTLACFQGRCEVVGLLLDRRANVEHRAKTGLTPLMEAASGGYVEVGRVLLDKGADVNATPVPSSRDTALTIASDKGHYRFVELLLTRGAIVDVKNKKGNSPLWLACNGGHLDVVQLLVNAGCDIDSQDNRKVSCLMSAFRKGHVKVVKWMVKHVNQFPADQEITRFIALINDKELLKKTNQCAEILRQAKERQAAEANKNASILLEEIDLERTREEHRKAAAARRRERKRIKKKEKQELLKVPTKGSNDDKSKLKDDYDDDDDDDSNDEDDDDDDVVVEVIPPPLPVVAPKEVSKEVKQKPNQTTKVTVEEKCKPSPKETERQRKASNNSNLTNHVNANTTTKKSTQQPMNTTNAKNKKTNDSIPSDSDSTQEKLVLRSNSSNISNVSKNSSVSQKNVQKSVSDHSSHRHSTDIFSELTVEMNTNVSSSASNRSPNYSASKGGATSAQPSNANQTKKGQKREEGWKEVVRKSKKVVVPSNAISRVIGRGGCNINAIREVSGAHIEVEKQKGQGDRMVIIKGSADATRHAQQLIAALSKETEKDLSEIIKSMGLNRPTSVSSDEIISTRNHSKNQSTAVIGSTARQQSTTVSNVLKSSSMGSVCTTSLSSNMTTFTNRSSMLVRTSAPITQSSPFVNAWNTRNTGSTRMPSTTSLPVSTTQHLTSQPVTTKSTVSYTMAVAAKGKNTKTTSISNIITAIPKVISSAEVKHETQMKPTSTPQMTNQLRPTGAPQGVQPFSHQMFTGARVPVPNNSNGVKNTSYLPTTKQPFNSLQTVTTAQSPTKTTTSVAAEDDKPPSATTPEYTPFNNLFSKVAQSSVWGQSKDNKPNFASVAASGLTSIASNQNQSNSLSTLGLQIQQNSQKELSIDASKAPGYRGNLHISPSNVSLSSTPSSSSGNSNLGPIGSGHARSAPCTPPLISNTGPLTPSSVSKMMTTPPLSGTPTPPPPQNTHIQNSRSMTDPQNQMFSMTNESNLSPISAQSPTKTTTSVAAEDDKPPSATTPEYTPFNNLFSKVAQSSVWGQSKDNKPNFASVAASGLTSIASNQNQSNSLSTALGLQIQQNSQKELSIDASKAPGYRGNLHISPSNVSLSSTPSSSSGNSNLGPIGSGHARSAPCTPPLISNTGPLTPSSVSKMMTTPPLSGTPTPPPPQNTHIQNSRSMTDPQNQMFSMTNESNLSPISGNPSPSHQLNVNSVSTASSVTSYQPLLQSTQLNPNLQSNVSNAIKSQSYNMSSTMNVPQRHTYVTNTTYTQNTPLPSVGTVHTMQMSNEQNQPVFGLQNTNNAIQSNLNPNAPDFSTRVSIMQSSHQMNGPSLTPQKRISRDNSGTNSSPNAAIVLQDQMRAAFLAASANLQLQTLQKQQAVRMQIAANHNSHLAANDFGTNTPPPSPETLRLLHTAINSLPNAPNPAHGMQHFGVMQANNYLPQQQQQQSRLSQTSINAMAVQKEMESNTDYEERRQLPRPIGTERAQRKNPNPNVYSQMNSLSNMNANDSLWPFGCEVMPNDMNEWMQSQQQLNPNIHSSNLMTDNSMSAISQNRFNSDDVSHFDSTFPMNVGSHASNSLNYSASGLPVMGMNGVPQHLSSAHYQSMLSNPAMNVTQDTDYWNSKIGSLSSVAMDNNVSQNAANGDQKMNWNHWNHQT
ncbi:unnamed protein product, partial [Medioppia subpectinata]